MSSSSNSRPPAVRYAAAETASPRASISADAQSLPMHAQAPGQAQGQPRRRTRGASVQSSSSPYGRDYKRFIVDHADRSARRHFYFGAHFTGLSNMLQAVPDAPRPGPDADFPYVVVREYGAEPSKPIEYAAATGHEQLQELKDPADGAPQIVFVRGYPSPQWIMALGQRFKLDIDFFRQHLNFLEELNYYSEPPWPSLSANFLRLRLPTIIRRQSALLRDGVGGRNEVEDMRRREYTGARDYQKRLKSVGESIVRRMCIHDETTFTVEQEIIVSVIKRGGSWTSIVWLDHGKLLPFDSDAPWQTKRRNENADAHADCVPLVQHLPPNFLGHTPKIDAVKAGDPSDMASHGGFFLPYGCGATLKPELMRNDPFYGLSEILQFAVNSQNQLLNRINHGVNESMAQADDDAMRALTDLNYSRRLVADALVYLEDTLAFLEQSNEKFWGLGLTPEGSNARTTLLKDLRCAIRRAKALSSSTSEGMAFITNGIMLVDSKKAGSKADAMHRLTVLACLFLPLSLVVGFYGINVVQFGSGTLSIWVVIVTFVPISLLVFLVCFLTEFLEFVYHVWTGLVVESLYPRWREFWHLLRGKPW